MEQKAATQTPTMSTEISPESADHPEAQNIIKSLGKRLDVRNTYSAHDPL